MHELVTSKPTAITDLIFLFFAFYVFGIIVWALSYLLLSLILLSLSFIAQGWATMKGFALSPIAMTMLMVSLVNLLAIGTSGDDMILSNPAVKDPDFISFNILVFALSLIRGYICVGIGFGIYKLLKQIGLIRDEARTEPELRSINQYG
jgi:hypothetical protein